MSHLAHSPRHHPWETQHQGTHPVSCRPNPTHIHCVTISQYDIFNSPQWYIPFHVLGETICQKHPIVVLVVIDVHEEPPFVASVQTTHYEDQSTLYV